jgi:UDP-2-acetamido-2,6-beta-L-arabino-hexul-4-ose reductase
LTHGNEPTIITDSAVKLIHVSSLCHQIIDIIRKRKIDGTEPVATIQIPPDCEKTVSEVLTLFTEFRNNYLENGWIPTLLDINQINLFNTFRSYIDHSTHFPVLLHMNTDERGTFVETAKLGTGGQVSFSTTRPGITRGNHFHTRKIERFTVIKGKAKICLRKTGTNDIMEFILDGDNPSFVDMPVWYTHNITNIGQEDLYTQFWINEWYNPQDPDTFFETV